MHGFGKERGDAPQLLVAARDIEGSGAMIGRMGEISLDERRFQITAAQPGQIVYRPLGSLCHRHETVDPAASPGGAGRRAGRARYAGGDQPAHGEIRAGTGTGADAEIGDFRHQGLGSGGGRPGGEGEQAEKPGQKGQAQAARLPPDCPVCPNPPSDHESQNSAGTHRKPETPRTGQRNEWPFRA